MSSFKANFLHVHVHNLSGFDNLSKFDSRGISVN